MIGVDTNVLLRAIMLDDRRQAKQAQDFLSARDRSEPALINSVVLAELVWSLRTHFGLPREEIASILRDMATSEAYAFVDREAVLDALLFYEGGLGQFTDRLIAEINDRSGCSMTVTFDSAAAKHAPFAALAS